MSVKTIAIVPARGGSKRIPNKNIKLFNSRPMLSYPLAILGQCDFIDKIHVSTDSEQIAQVAKDFGFAPEFMRPPEIADDLTPTMPVLKFVLEEYERLGETYANILVFNPCTPLIVKSDVEAAFLKFNSDETCDVLFTIAKYPAPAQWAFTMNDHGILTAREHSTLAQRSQDLEETYYETGSFNFLKDSCVRGDMTDPRTKGHLISREKAVDIDTLEDWQHAELLHRLTSEHLHHPLPPQRNLL